MKKHLKCVLRKINHLYLNNKYENIAITKHLLLFISCYIDLFTFVSVVLK